MPAFNCGAERIRLVDGGPEWNAERTRAFAWIPPSAPTRGTVASILRTATRLDRVGHDGIARRTRHHSLSQV